MGDCCRCSLSDHSHERIYVCSHFACVHLAGSFLIYLAEEPPEHHKEDQLDEQRQDNHENRLTRKRLFDTRINLPKPGHIFPSRALFCTLAASCKTRKMLPIHCNSESTESRNCKQLANRLQKTSSQTYWQVLGDCSECWLNRRFSDRELGVIRMGIITGVWIRAFRLGRPDWHVDRR